MLPTRRPDSLGTFRLDCPYCRTKAVAFATVGDEIARGQFFDFVATCGYCARLVIVTLRSGRIKQVVPQEPTFEAPLHTPKAVARYFVQAEDNLPANPDAAGVMFRKALETALRVKFPNLSGRLIDRIDAAAAQHKLTPEMANWAHRIRLLGNEAAHDDEPFSRGDAESLSSFCRLLLLYLFTLPGMMQEARAEDDG